MNSATCLKFVVRYLHVICKLLASENQSYLVNLNAFLLLQGLLNLKDGVLILKVKTLFLASQGLYE